MTRLRGHERAEQKANIKRAETALAGGIAFYLITSVCRVERITAGFQIKSASYNLFLKLFSLAIGLNLALCVRYFCLFQSLGHQTKTNITHGGPC